MLRRNMNVYYKILSKKFVSSLVGWQVLRRLKSAWETGLGTRLLRNGRASRWRKYGFRSIVAYDHGLRTAPFSRWYSYFCMLRCTRSWSAEPSVPSKDLMRNTRSLMSDQGSKDCISHIPKKSHKCIINQIQWFRWRYAFAQGKGKTLQTPLNSAKDLPYGRTIFVWGRWQCIPRRQLCEIEIDRSWVFDNKPFNLAPFPLLSRSSNIYINETWKSRSLCCWICVVSMAVLRVRFHSHSRAL